MKFLLKIKMPMETGNKRLRDPQFGQKMHQILTEIKAEAAYFTTIDGCRGAYVVVNMTDASQMPSIAEPFFFWLDAEICTYPVMTPEDLAKGTTVMESIIQKWG